MRELAGNIIRFSNNTAGMEKILKGLLGLLLIPGTPTFKSISSISHGARCKVDKASKELSIARKVVKFLYVLDAGLKALEARKGAKGGPLKWFIVGKWACAFVYAASEAVTILHTMRVLNIVKSKWAHSANRKGHKFYFFSIVFSVLASAYQLYEITIAQHQLRREKRRVKHQRIAMAASVGVATPYAAHVRYSSSSDSSDSFSSSDSSSSSEDERRRRHHHHQHHHHSQGQLPVAGSPVSSASSAASPTLNPAVLAAEARLANAAEWERKKLFIDAARTSGTRNEDKPKTGAIVTQLLADVCDLAIPASKVGWYKNKEAISLAYLLSSVLAGSVIWGRVNAKTSTHERRGSHPGIKMVRKDEFDVKLSEEDRRRYELRIEEERRKHSGHSTSQLATAAGVGLAAGLAAGAIHERKSSKSKYEATSSSTHYEESRKSSGRSKSETGYDIVHHEDDRRRSSSQGGHGHGHMAAAAGVGLAAGLAAGAIAGNSSSSHSGRTKSEAGLVSSTRLEEERRRKSTGSGNVAAAVGAGAAAGYVAGTIAEGSSSSRIDYSHQSQSEFSSSTRIEEERRKQNSSYNQGNVAATAGLAAGLAAGYTAGAIAEGSTSSNFGYSHQSQSEFSSSTHLNESSSYAQGSSSYAQGNSGYTQGSSYGQQYAGYGQGGNSYGQGYVAGAVGASVGTGLASGATGCSETDAGRSHSVAGRIEDSSYQRELEQQREMEFERSSRAASTADVSTIVDVDVTASMTEAAATSIANKSKKRTGYGGWSYDDENGTGGLNETHWGQNGLARTNSIPKAEEDEHELRARIQGAKDVSDMDVSTGGTGQLKPYSTLTYAKVAKDGDKDGATVDI
ncbi:hypothetical protein TWF506_010120 [Arthrobotrys conoides]|uniref:Uncharacterized protein n=1 Tax=Arthrobotrys conoides TaxID=74498 RepID=A0AAN8NLH9_9PEZI